MVSKKAPILLLDAFRRASEVCPYLRLDYVGDGELFSAAQQFVRAFEMADRVTLRGSQPADVVVELMRKADIFMQHSMTDPVTGDEEGLPVAILEAMATASPCCLPAMPEYLTQSSKTKPAFWLKKETAKKWQTVW